MGESKPNSAALKEDEVSDRESEERVDVENINGGDGDDGEDRR